jgi:hypothetical protein
MTIAFVLGNGVSRKSVNLAQAKAVGPIYGCNALYRDFTPYCLIATDRPISEEIQNSGYSLTNRFYTRRPIHNLGALTIPQKYYGNSSGPIACAIAAEDGNSKIFMLGFDMGPDHGQRFNNIYAGTDFYKKADAVPTFTGNWVRQIIQIARDFSSTEFVRVIGDTTADIPEFKAISNIRNMPMLEFLERLANPVVL